MMAKQTKDCPYCECGLTPEGRKCVDCNGAGVRCILCGEPPSRCKCALSRFDGDPVSREMRDHINRKKKR